MDPYVLHRHSRVMTVSRHRRRLMIGPLKNILSNVVLSDARLTHHHGYSVALPSEKMIACPTPGPQVPVHPRREVMPPTTFFDWRIITCYLIAPEAPALWDIPLHHNPRSAGPLCELDFAESKKASY